MNVDSFQESSKSVNDVNDIDCQPNPMPIESITDLIVIFFNPSSGNCQGMHLEEYDALDYRIRQRDHVRVQMYDIKIKEHVLAGTLNIKHHLLCNEGRVIVISAGGDGTFVTAIRQLNNAGIDVYAPRIFFSCVPLGTGNDLSQSIGWGRRLDMSVTKSQKAFNKELLRRLDGQVIFYDLWSVILETRQDVPDAYVETRGTTIRVGHINTLMSNYMSLGLQGEVGVSFEQRRHHTRFMNILEYTKQSIKLFFKGNVLRLGHFFGDLTSSSGQYTLASPAYGRAVEMVIQNIPGIWGRQVKLWTDCEMSPSILTPKTGDCDQSTWSSTATPGDGRIEVFAVKSRWDYLKKQFPFFRKHVWRLGQFQDLKMTFIDKRDLGLHGIWPISDSAPDEVYCMIDGEFFNVRHPSSLTVKRAGQIKVLTNVFS